MRKYLSLLMLITFACDNNSEGSKKAEVEYGKKVEEELKSGARNDEIFMIFRFGDAENDVDDKFRQLKDSGKLFIDERGYYTYTFVFNEHDTFNGYATFKQEFHDGKLYKLRMMVRPHDDMIALGGGSDEYIELKNSSLFFQLASLFLGKYGSPIQKSNILFDTKDYFWIDGNREISISKSSSFVNIYYTDLFALKSIEQEKKDKMLNKANNTRADI